MQRVSCASQAIGAPAGARAARNNWLEGPARGSLGAGCEPAVAMAAAHQTCRPRGEPSEHAFCAERCPKFHEARF